MNKIKQYSICKQAASKLQAVCSCEFGKHTERLHTKRTSKPLRTLWVCYYAQKNARGRSNHLEANQRVRDGCEHARWQDPQRDDVEKHYSQEVGGCGIHPRSLFAQEQRALLPPQRQRAGTHRPTHKSPNETIELLKKKTLFPHWSKCVRSSENNAKHKALLDCIPPISARLSEHVAMECLWS